MTSTAASIRLAVLRRSAPAFTSHLAQFLILVLTLAVAMAPGTEIRAQATGSYTPGPWPDRIILTPTDTPAQSQAVNWRTDDSVADTIAEISIATASPAFQLSAIQFAGTAQHLQTDNGASLHHGVVFENLIPDTTYAYRVGGNNTWSEWFQFRTARADFAPFKMLYFGDAQNGIRSLFSRVARTALLHAPDAALALHAGDLIDRSGVMDDNWGEWFHATSASNTLLNNLVVSGNHEYDESTTPVTLRPHWATHFHVPDNGPTPLQDSVFYVDYQQVRFVILDSTRAMHDESMALLQARWLQNALSNNTALWTVVSYHHPVYSISHGRENTPLYQHWKPLFDQYGVDLVLQGHDHVYARGRTDTGIAVPGSASSGPVYVVSVAGPKLNLTAESARQHQSHLGEDAQLFQIIRFEADQLHYQARTATGEPYDAFTLQRRADGSNELLELTPGSSLLSVCQNPDPIPRHIDETGRARPGRCWTGEAQP